MCGRFTLRVSPAELVEAFALVREPDLAPRYNIAPTQSVAVVRPDTGGRQLSFLHWGLVPSWSKDRSGAARMINARGETAATKPSFRAAFQRRRCLVPADGFYEWKKTGGKTKQPYCMTLRRGGPFAFAGLWDTWKGNGEEPLESCTIITGEPNELVRAIHDRMPVIIPEEEYDTWLDPQQKDVDTLQRLLVPYPAEEMRAVAVRTVVNNPRVDSPECVEPA